MGFEGLGGGLDLGLAPWGLGLGARHQKTSASWRGGVARVGVSVASIRPFL